MYGMINKALEQMIVAQHGEEAWSSVLAGADSRDSVAFVSLKQYPDQLTYRLMASASTVLDCPSDALLRAFGRYWIQFASKGGYGELLRLTGRTFREFLGNLDRMHARVGLSFSGLKPPSFECFEQAEQLLHLHYRSGREGLEPMVMGLVEGLASMFGQTVVITLVQPRDADGLSIFEIAIEA